MTAKLAFGAHLARYPRHFTGKAVQLVEHGVDGVGIFEKFAAQRPSFNVPFHALGQHAACDRADDSAGIAYRLHQVVDQRVDGIDLDAPGTVRIVEFEALTELAFGADGNRYLLDELGQFLVGADNVVERIGDLAIHARPVAR